MSKRAAGTGKKGRGGKRQGAGRPPGRENNRTILLRAGLDHAIPDDYFFRKVREAIEAGGPSGAQMLIQVGKWKGLSDRHELVGDSFAPGTIFQSILSSGEAALAPPEKGGDGPAAK